LWLALAVGLWRRRECSRRFTLIALPLQLVFWLGDWWIFSRSAIAIQSFGFELGLRLLASALAAAILLLSGRWEAGRRGERAAESTERETAQSHGE
jgi:hypothetical protein